MSGNSIGESFNQDNDIQTSLLERPSLNVIKTRNFILQIRNGHNFYTMRFGEDSVLPQSDQQEGIIALKKETDLLYREKLKANGFILGVTELNMYDPRVIKLGLEQITMAALIQARAGYQEHWQSLKKD